MAALRQASANASPSSAAGATRGGTRSSSTGEDRGEPPTDRPLAALASELGLTSEALYRLLARLEREGAIRRRGLQGQLRFAHLNAHLKTADLLSAEQVERYDRLRGYL